MRTILVVAILLFGVASATPEPEYSAMPPGSLQRGSGQSSLVEIETSIVTADREPVAAVPPVQTTEPSPGAATTPTSDAATPADVAAPGTGPAPNLVPIPTPAEAASAPSLSLDELCNALLTSAQNNGLPVAFFANLIWQESRLRNDALSPKGAMGIAQFMPKVAAKSGVENPFDPLQALPASAKLLRDLRDQFGNLGYVAAAYNAGAQRVMDWLQRGRTLPRETRGYVMDITGQSVEAWRKTPKDDAALRFARRLPCRELPAFAELEQAQAQQAQQMQQAQQALQAQQAQQAALEHARAVEAHAEIIPAQKPAAVRPLEKRKAAAVKRRELHARLAKDDRPRQPIRREPPRTAERERVHAKHEARERIRHPLREKRRRA